MFDSETRVTVLNRLQYENKLMETCSMEMNIHPVSKENLDAAKIHIQRRKTKKVRLQRMVIIF